MNIAVRTDKMESTPAADPLDHLASKLFHPMGTDGGLCPDRAL